MESLFRNFIEAFKEGDNESVRRAFYASAGEKNANGRKILKFIVSARHEELPEVSSTDQPCCHCELLDLFKRLSWEFFSSQIKEMCKKGWEVTHDAVFSNCPDVVAWLDKEGCNLDATGEEFGTPLSLAAEWGKLKAMEYLMASGKCSLTSRDSYGYTPLLRGCFGLQAEATALLLNHEKGKDKLCKSSSECIAAVHSVLVSTYSCKASDDASTCGHVEVLKQLKTSFKKRHFRNSMRSKDELGCSVVQLAAHKNCTILLKYLHQTENCQMDEPDNDGDTALCDSAFYGLKTSVTYLTENGHCNVEHKNKRGETPFLLACSNLQIETAKYLAEDCNANTRAIDYCDNSGLHLACVSLTSDDQQVVKQFNSIISWLRGLEADSMTWADSMKAINASKYNVLMVMAECGNLGLFMEQFAQDPHIMCVENPTVADILRNADGLNILHVHATKHSLKDLHEKFRKSSYSALWDSLIKEKVHKGCYRGFGCLHFACQLGHLQNINYLLKNYPANMKLKERLDSSGLSAMGVLIKHRHENLLKDLQPVTFQHVVECVDDVLLALTIPSADEAKQILLPLCDHDLKGVVMRPHLYTNEQYMSGRATTSGQGKINYSHGVRLFLMALKQDSTEILRSLIALGFWSYLSTTRAEIEFNAYLRHLIETETAPEEHAATISHVLPSLHKGFDLKWSPTEPNSICFDLPYPSLLGIAIRSGRINIAKDLILLDQYYLVPTCMAVINECQILAQENNALREYADELHLFALNVTLNAMNELDRSPYETKHKLLHKFIGGRFVARGQSRPETHGPRFLGFHSSQRKEQSVLELAVTSGCDEALASSCFVNFSKTEWMQRSVEAGQDLQLKTKFHFHCVLFMFFFAFLTFFVCSVAPNNKWMDATLYVFTFSFLVQNAYFAFMTTKEAIVDNTRSKMKQVQRCLSEYFFTSWSAFEIIGITLIIAGLSLKAAIDDCSNVNESVTSSWNYFLIRIMFSLSHLCWTFKFVSFLRASELVGPSLSMLKTLLSRDLLPFLVIFLTICLSFGVFFFNLLYPDSKSYSTSGSIGERNLLYMLSIYTRPLLTAFGEMEMDDLSNCENLSAQWSSFNETSNIPSDATCTHPVGTFHYRKYAIFPFLFLINLTMLNMLIAKFSLTVSSKEDVAYMIWRRYDAELLMDYRRLPTLPPPLTLIWLLYLATNYCWRRYGFFGNFKPQRTAGSLRKKSTENWWSRKNLENSFLKPMCETSNGNWNSTSRAAKYSGNLQSFNNESFEGGRIREDSDSKSDSDGSDTPQESSELICRASVNASAHGLEVKQSKKKAFCKNECLECDEDFKDYIIFQAINFRGKRIQFTKPRKDHGSMMEKLKIDIQNLTHVNTVPRIHEE